MKHWDTHGDRPGPTDSLIWHKGELELHPSGQVRGYTQYRRNFHSAVLDEQADVDGASTSPSAAPPDESPTAVVPGEHW
jgi:hypothetical protein